MSEDPSNVPRRLRRFYRNGQPIPGGDESESENNPPQPVMDKSPEDEPWMNPSKNVPRRIQRKTGNANQAMRSAPPLAAPPRGVFEKINEKSQAGVPHLDKTLGLEKKSEIHESLLPSGGARALQTTPSNVDVQAALSKLKELATKDTQNASSFHFTPVGGTPSAVEPSKLDEKSNLPIAGNSLLSPRERMEMRRQRGGEPPEGSPNVVSGRPSSSQETEGGMNPNTPAHIRRRMGQRTDQTGSDMGADEPASSPAPSGGEDEDFKSLFNDDKKKKKKPASEDEDLDLSDEMPMFEDEK
ncbi:MAG: hypothetical protein AABX02_04005 [archaeon]